MEDDHAFLSLRSAESATNNHTGCFQLLRESTWQKCCIMSVRFKQHKIGLGFRAPDQPHDHLGVYSFGSLIQWSSAITVQITFENIVSAAAAGEGPIARKCETL